MNRPQRQVICPTGKGQPFSLNKVCRNHATTHPIMIAIFTTSRSRPSAN